LVAKLGKLQDHGEGSSQPPRAADREAATSRREQRTVRQRSAAENSGPRSSDQPPGAADREAATSRREQRTGEGSDQPPGTADRRAAASRREQRTC